MNEQSFETIHCSRCTREASREEMDSHRLTGLLPDGWEGWLPDGGVCPGCQSAFWHPHCRSLVDIEGERVDVQAIPREEWTGEVDWCDYVDRENGYLEENWPETWTCPEYGGTEFELVHSDSFNASIEPRETDGDGEHS